MLDPKRPFLISPPFGTYFKHRLAYSVFGSYTRFARPGRMMQILRTVRPLGYTEKGEPNGWVNKVGLRNPGWKSIGKPEWEPHQIASLALIEGDTFEWDALCRFMSVEGNGTYVHTAEINISCPNTGHQTPALPNPEQMKILLHKHCTVIWKLPPVNASITAALVLADMGAKYIHLSNTLPSPIGGLSGRALREANLPLVEATATTLTRKGFKLPVPFDKPDDPFDLELIGGGGIYSRMHLRHYFNAGASRFSMSTAWFKPWRAVAVMKAL